MTIWDEITFTSELDVKLIRAMMDDASVVQAARVSTQGENVPTEDAPGLIKYLMNNRHGSPFEHNSITFYVHAPIFVFREFMRHRIASYNEESARYTQLKPVFYVPPRERPLVQIGRPGHYKYVAGSETQWEETVRVSKQQCVAAYLSYVHLLESTGIAREVARNVLPVDIYSSMYVTVNSRSLMNFLSLRVQDERSMFPSTPQWEINRVADKMEAIWAELMPITHSSFVSAGRVCP